jgi:hypothetical protein
MSLETNPYLIREAFEYFAKFPEHGNVMGLFEHPSTDNSYNELKDLIAGLSIHSQIPGLEHYLFSRDEKRIKKMIEDINGPFLFLDYGNLKTNQDNLKRKKDSFQLAITVAEKQNPDDLNVPEAVLFSDKTLNMMRLIRNIMLQDQKCSPFVKQLEFPHEISPFYARGWSNATGWSMVFERSGVDLL